MTVIPRRFGVLLSTASPSRLEHPTTYRVYPRPSRAEITRSRVRRTTSSSGDERVERPHVPKRAGALVAARREGEGEPRLPRARILGGRATEPFAGERETTGGQLGLSEEAPRLGRPRRESPRALGGLARRSRVAAVERLVRVRRGAVAGMRDRRHDREGGGRAREPRPAPTPRSSTEAPEPARRTRTTPRSTDAERHRGDLEVPVEHEVEEERDVGGQRGPAGRVSDCPPDSEQRDPEGRHQEGQPDRAELGERLEVAVVRVLRVQERGPLPDPGTLVAPRALAEERLPADHRERDPPVVAARARRRAEQPVGRALLRRRGGAHLADLAHADDHDPDCGERCDGRDGAPRGARQPDRRAAAGGRLPRRRRGRRARGGSLPRRPRSRGRRTTRPARRRAPRRRGSLRAGCGRRPSTARSRAGRRARARRPRVTRARARGRARRSRERRRRRRAPRASEAPSRPARGRGGSSSSRGCRSRSHIRRAARGGRSARRPRRRARAGRRSSRRPRPRARRAGDRPRGAAAR